MKILLTGASGFIGRALKPQLEALGYTVVELSTRERLNAYTWRPGQNNIPQEALCGVDTVIHLAASPIDRLWTPSRKTLIYKSRVCTTKALCEQLLALPAKPRRVIFASGAHICPYLPDPEAPVRHETDIKGSFLATVVRDWELAAHNLEEAHIATLHLRLGVVMSPRGGMLKKILPLARYRLMPILGRGHYGISWISLEDLVGLILWILKTEGLKGPLCAVAPGPISQLEWATALAHYYHYKPWLYLPEGLLKRILGQMATELLFTSLWVEPKKLLDKGYPFCFSSFSDYLNFSLA